MDLIRKNEMKRIDEYTSLNITPAIDLMEIAGKKMADIVIKNYSPKRVLLLCGASGNGGDAFVCGRYLINSGIICDAYLISNKFNKECQINYDLFKGNVFNELPSLNCEDKYDLIIDGLIGIGLNRNLDDKYIDVINLVNLSNINIVSLDIPTGINADNGLSMGGYVKCDLCISVMYHKCGLFLNDGLDSYKKLELINIGMVEPLSLVHLNDIFEFKNIYPKRLRNTNKGSYNRAYVIAGSYKYPGASLISYTALASLKMGVGYQGLAIPDVLYNAYALVNPSLMIKSLSSVDGHIKYCEDELKSLLNNEAISIGMGMDISIDLYKSICYLLTNYNGILIIDADAINSLAMYGKDVLKTKKCDVIITPHIKEFSRLTGIDKNLIVSNPIDYAYDFSKKYNVCLILKSASSIITDGDKLCISAFGNTSLAKGGSGDMLAGILAGVCAYLDTSLYTKACLSAFILGYASECACRSIAAECVTYKDICDNLNNAILKIKE